MQIMSEQMQAMQQRMTAAQYRVRQIESFFQSVNASPAFSCPTTPAAPRSCAGATDVEPLIARAAAQYQLRPSLLRAVIQQESGYNPLAVSPRGARGLMQLMPSTAASLGVSDPFDPEQNVMAGARYLSQQLASFNGDERLALAAYNAGPGAVQRYGGIPPFPETQRYVADVLSLAGQ